MFVLHIQHLRSSKEGAKLNIHEDENILCAYELENDLFSGLY